MTVYGYLRVSTDEQDYNSQKQGVDEFAKTSYHCARCRITGFKIF